MNLILTRHIMNSTLLSMDTKYYELGFIPGSFLFSGAMDPPYFIL